MARRGGSTIVDQYPGEVPPPPEDRDVTPPGSGGEDGGGPSPKPSPRPKPKPKPGPPPKVTRYEKAGLPESREAKVEKDAAMLAKREQAGYPKRPFVPEIPETKPEDMPETKIRSEYGFIHGSGEFSSADPYVPHDQPTKADREATTRDVLEFERKAEHSHRFRLLSDRLSESVIKPMPDNEKRQLIKQSGQAIAYPQGKLQGKTVWRTLVNPGRNNAVEVVVLGSRPTGAKIVKDKDTAVKRIESILSRSPAATITEGARLRAPRASVSRGFPRISPRVPKLK